MLRSPRNPRRVVFPIVVALLAASAAGPAWSQAAINCSSELYGVTQNGSLFRTNINTAAAMVLGATQVNLSEIAWDNATNTLWATDGSTGSMLRKLNPSTGAQMSAVSFGSGAINGLEFVGGVLYGTWIPSTGGGAPSSFVTINTATGALTTIGATGITAPISGLAYDSSSSTMYGVTAGGGGLSALVRINMATGAATFIGSTGYFKVGSIEIGPDGNLYGGVAQDGAISPSGLLRINKATGVATLIGLTNFSIVGLAACQSGSAPPILGPTIPVNAPWAIGLTALMLFAAGAWTLARRRREPRVRRGAAWPRKD